MRKVLLGSTALVAASILAGATTAQAAEKIKLGLGGYMEQWWGYTDQDDVPTGTEDLNGFGSNSDTEVFFTGSTTLDNGITFGVNIQLEGNTSGDTIDESYAIIRGDFGEINVGSENSAQYKMGYIAPDVGIGVNSGDTTAWASFAGIGGSTGYNRGGFGSTSVEAARANDVNRLTYYTPRFAGIQFGASYAPATQEDGFGTFDEDAILHDGFSLGLNFVESFNGIDVAVAGGYGRWEDVAGTTDDPEAWNVGLNIGFAGFTVGGSYAQANNDGTSVSGGDMDSYDVGVSYSTGPWAVSLTYLHGERDGSAGILEADLDIVHGSVNYALGPGVNFVGTVGYADIQDESGAGTDNEAVYIVVGPKLSF